ncbi:MAG: hypothetical protein PHF64_11880 [Methanoregula sp.]|nr:hypothetical protein [Methanoregula sp.]
MKNLILLALICSLFCAGTVSAYGLYVDCPKSLQAGQTLKCTIDSDLPVGTSFDMAFYQSQYTATILDTQTVTIQDGHPTQYKLFDTRGFKGGQYKMEIQFNSGYLGTLRDDSRTDQLIMLVDRSDAITITSPESQLLANALQIDGSIAKKGGDGVEIEVKGQNTGRVFGPEYIPTTKDMKNGAGVFTRKVVVTQPDVYDVSFSDPNGFIGAVSFEVTTPAPTVTSTPLSTVTFRTTRTTSVTTPPTPTPTPTKSPLPELVVIGALGICAALYIHGSRKE